MLYEAEYAPEHLIVKGAVVIQPKGYYVMGIKSYELPINLPSGRIVAVTYKNCRVSTTPDGNTSYEPYDIGAVLIDFGWLGMSASNGSDLVVVDGRLCCIGYAL